MDSERMKSLLAPYPLEVEDVDDFGGIWRLWTDRGVKCLRQVEQGEERLQEMARVLFHLAEQGFRRTARPIMGRDGRLWVKEGEKVYYLTDWFDGQPFDYRRDEDVVQGAALLGELHRNTEGLAGHGAQCPWTERIGKRLEELEAFAEGAQSGGKGFSPLFREGVEGWLAEAREALEAFARLPQEGPRVFCHRQWRETNLLKKPFGAPWVLGFDYGTFDHPAYDLGRFIRKVMARRQWRDGAILPELLKAYRQERPAFDRREGEFLLAYLTFPRKAWLLGARHYRGGGQWRESRLIKELKGWRRQEGGRREILRQLGDAVAQAAP